MGSTQKSNICIIRVPEREKQDTELKEYFEKIMAKLPKFGKRLKLSNPRS